MTLSAFFGSIKITGQPRGNIIFQHSPCDQNAEKDSSKCNIQLNPKGSDTRWLEDVIAASIRQAGSSTRFERGDSMAALGHHRENFWIVGSDGSFEDPNQRLRLCRSFNNWPLPKGLSGK
jgi:hypothetical protein